MIGLIGGGYWGKNLIRNFHDLGALAIVCDSNMDALKRVQAQYPDVQVTQTFSNLINDPDIDAIAIATPAELHYTHARETLLAGKDAYVEKPLSLSHVEAKELVEIAKQRKRILMVGHLLQYHSAYLKLKEMVQNGELGRIDYIYSHRLNFGKIRREENALWSFAPHDISMILSLAGDMPETVYATGGNYLHQKIADVTTTHMSFPSGIRAHIFVSWLHPFKEQKLVVVGEKQMAVFNDILPWDQKLVLYSHHVEWKNNAPVPVKAEGQPIAIEESEPLKAECSHFLDCIKTRRVPRTDGMEGMRVLQILNSAQESLETGKTIRLTKEEDISHPKYFVHETAVIDENVTIGNGTKIWHFSHILSNTKIGEQCNIGQNVVIGPDVKIGKGCKIQNNVSVYKGVTLEDGVFCGPSMVFTNIYNPRAEIRKMDQVRPTLVKKGATIGANATIVCGITIGRYAFVGAGAVVIRDVPDYALVVGNPARQIGWACECGERLYQKTPDMLECGSCGKTYRKAGEKIQKIE